MHSRKHPSVARTFDRYITDNIHTAQPRQRPPVLRLARSHQPTARSSRQRYAPDTRLHLLHFIDQPGKQSRLRSDAQPGHCCTYGNLHHLDRVRASQKTPWRGPSFGPLVTRPIRARCQCGRFDLHELVGKSVIRPNTSDWPAYDIVSSSGRSGLLPTTSTARRSTGHARCSSLFWAVRF